MKEGKKIVQFKVVVLHKKKRKCLLDEYYQLIQRIIQLSEKITAKPQDKCILKEGQRLVLAMISLYQLTQELIFQLPERKETRRIQHLYQKNPHQLESFIRKEIAILQEKYRKGKRAQQEKEDPSAIKNSYWQIACNNLHCYQEMMKKNNCPQERGHR